MQVMISSIPSKIISTLLLTVLLLPLAWSQTQSILIDLDSGQLPNDTGLDNRTLLSITDYERLGGKALKVIYAPSDSFGNNNVGETNWGAFETFDFEVYNPGRIALQLTFSLKHRDSVDYQTRVNIPLMLAPGKTSFSFDIDDFRNSNGEKPDLSDVRQWYIATGNSAPTLYFSNFVLNRSATSLTPQVVDVIRPDLPEQIRLQGTYRVTGTIGGQSVDLLLRLDDSQVMLSNVSGSGRKDFSDPFRIARIRATSMPQFDGPVLFNTTEADSIVSALEVFPEDNPFNQVVSTWPLHENSTEIVKSTGLNDPLRYNLDMAFVLVPPNQPRVDVELTTYAAESDPGPYPIPDILPIEGWPAIFQSEIDSVSGLDLKQVQEKGEGDRHAIIVDPVNRMLYEFANTRLVNDKWTATQASIFDLSSNQLRRSGWTSSDAAGLPIFPAVVRYDELMRGEIEHALRVTVPKTRRAFVAPATHFASRLEDVNLPRMGERIRLRAGFDITGFSPEAQTILRALQKYGMFVADNGIAWAISVAPDSRIPDMNRELRRIRGRDFEVVTTPP